MTITPELQMGRLRQRVTCLILTDLKQCIWDSNLECPAQVDSFNHIMQLSFSEKPNGRKIRKYWEINNSLVFTHDATQRTETFKSCIVYSQVLVSDVLDGSHVLKFALSLYLTGIVISFDPQNNLYTTMLGYSLIHVCGFMYLCVCVCVCEEVFQTYGISKRLL